MTHREPIVPMVTDEGAPPAVRETFKHVSIAMGKVPHLARIVANSPPILDAFMGLAGAVAMEHKVPMPLKELAVMRASELNGCAYCKGMHRPILQSMGVADAKIDAVAVREIVPGIFDDKELVVLRLTDEMTEHVAAKPETVQKARALFGEAGTVELMITIGFYNLMNRLAESTQVPLE